MKSVVFLFVLLFAPPLYAASSGLQAGEQAPLFTAKDVSGETVKLKRWRGHPIVLEWSDPKCDTVQKLYETGMVQALQREVIQQGGGWLTVLSAARDHRHYLSEEEARTEAMRNGVEPNPLLLDGDGVLAKLYRVVTAPMFFVIDGDGTLVYSGALDDNAGRPRAVMGEARNYVREALAAIAADGAAEVTTSKPYGCPARGK